MVIENTFEINLDTSMKEFERNIKKIYERYPERQLATPHSYEEVYDIINEILTKSNDASFQRFFSSPSLLEETSWFTSDSDVEIYQHLRYLPAIWHSHDFIELNYVVSGCSTNYILKQKIEMHAGDICIIAPNTRHSNGAFSDDCIIYNYLIRTSTFNTAFFGLLTTDDILSDFFTKTLYHSSQYPYLLFQTGTDRDLLCFLGLSYHEFQRNRQYKRHMLNSILETFFIALFRFHGSSVVLPDTDSTPKDENTVLILKYLSNHYDTLTLSQLAEFFHYSKRQVQRIIKAATGFSFSEIIQQLKIKQAIKLLEKTNKPISVIAEELGYTDPANFRYFFKKYYNMTPAEYKASLSRKD